MPIIDLELYIQGSQSENPSEAAVQECKKVAECFHHFGIILIRDPRVNMQDND
jgi:isopenicillin N synthase-like dioxygenase